MPDTPPVDLIMDPAAAAREKAFQEWYGQVAKARKMNPNPDDPQHFYDYRTLFDNMVAKKSDMSPGKAGDHMTSEYKREGHPRMYLDDTKGRLFDTKQGTYVGSGKPVPGRLLDRAEHSPDTFLDRNKVDLMKQLAGVLPYFR